MLALCWVGILEAYVKIDGSSGLSSRSVRAHNPGEARRAPPIRPVVPCRSGPTPTPLRRGNRILLVSIRE